MPGLAQREAKMGTCQAWRRLQGTERKKRGPSYAVTRQDVQRPLAKLQMLTERKRGLVLPIGCCTG